MFGKNFVRLVGAHLRPDQPQSQRYPMNMGINWHDSTPHMKHEHVCSRFRSHSRNTSQISPGFLRCSLRQFVKKLPRDAQRDEEGGKDGLPWGLKRLCSP